jgi:hypothetical protein
MFARSLLGHVPRCGFVASTTSPILRLGGCQRWLSSAAPQDPMDKVKDPTQPAAKLAKKEDKANKEETGVPSFFEQRGTFVRPSSLVLPLWSCRTHAVHAKRLNDTLTHQMFKVMNPELYFARTDELDGKLTFTQKWYGFHENMQTGADHSTPSLSPSLLLYRSICAAGVLMVSW